MDKLIDALDMARHLMDNDPATFKRGYTLDNAVIAAAEFHSLDEDETASLRRMLTKATA